MIREVQATVNSLESIPAHVVSAIQFSGMPVAGPNLGSFLTATRLEEIIAWKGKTFMGRDYPLYGFSYFKKLKAMKDILPIEVNLLVSLHLIFHNYS